MPLNYFKIKGCLNKIVLKLQGEESATSGVDAKATILKDHARVKLQEQDQIIKDLKLQLK